MFGRVFDKATIGIMLVMFDLIVVGVYLFSLALLKNLQNIDVKEINGEVKKCSDFSIQLNTLPKNFNDQMELKAIIWDWVEKKLNAIDGIETFLPWIVDIYFGLNNYDNLKVLKKIRNLEKDVIEQNIEFKQEKNSHLKVVIYKKLQKTLNEMKKAIKKYEKTEKKREKDAVPIFAYIIFINQSDSKKLINLCNKTWIQR